MLLTIFAGRPRKGVSLETHGHGWDSSHSHTQGVSHMWSQDCLHSKEEAAVAVFRKPILGSVLTKAKRSLGFLLWGGYAHLNQMKNKRNMNMFPTVL